MENIITEKALNNAYAKQKERVTEMVKTKGIAGYKAAVSSKAGQQKMGLTTLISGVLYKDGNLSDNSKIALSEFKLGKIETEVGYILKDDITEATTAESVKDLVSEMLPVFELPDVTSADPSKITAIELISSNTFSSKQVLGKGLPVSEIDPDSIAVELYFNNELINTGKGSDAMDNQWEALSVAINFALEHGYTPKKGEVVITGALGIVNNLQKGIYKANYGKLGNLRLQVV